MGIRFNSPKKFMAYADIDPAVRQSGNFCGQKIICQARVGILRQNNPECSCNFSPKEHHLACLL
ncbi:MAG: transposase [bacterium]